MSGLQPNSVNIPPDIICFYCDLGRPYFPLMERMTQTAKAVMPGSRIILLTNKIKSPEARLFTHVVQLDFETDIKTVCYEKARCIASWQRGSGNNSIFVDPDIEFLKPVVFPDADVGLIWRKKAAQPVNSGMIFAKPGHDLFWDKYLSVAGGLPKVLRAWWCDQLAFSLLTGVTHSVGDELNIMGAKVRLMDEIISCSRPEFATPETQSLHWKGSRKGEGWDKFFTEDSSGKVAASA